jgi:hypothetical protein
MRPSSGLSEDIEGDQEARLLKTLDEKIDGARKTSVLVFGDGLNLQASRLQGQADARQWNDILRSIWKDYGGDLAELDNLASPTMQWTALVDLRSRTKGVGRGDAEADLRRTVCTRLRRLEGAQVGKKTLYSEIVDAGFAHVVSFNIDRRLIGHIHPSEREGPPAGSSFLQRRIRLKGKGGTSVWFPYGDLGDPKSFEIGHSTYDERLMRLEDYRKGTIDQWFGWNSNYSQYELRPPREVYWRLWNSVNSWYDLFFLAPLVFVGVSLTTDDWPLWWLLHQRARNFVPFEKDDFYQIPETFYLTVKDGDTSHLEGSPAGIELVKFESYDSMWLFIRRAIARKGA